MKLRMTFVTILLFAELALAVTAGSLGGGEIATRIGMALALTLPLLLLSRAPLGTPPIRLAVRDRRAWWTLLLLPSFILLTALVSLGWSALAELIGLPLQGAVPLSSVALAILFDALLPAVCEEIFCRGLLFSSLRPMGRRAAVLGSAFLFSLMHANPAQIPYAFTAGVLLALLLEYTGSLLLPILFHFGNNLLSLATFFGLPLPQFFILLGGAVALTLPAFLLWARKAHLPRPPHEATPRHLLSDFFLSPLLLWIAVILTFILF